MSPHCAQIFFARPPVPGEVKTRLAYFLGNERACNLYIKMLKSLLLSFQEKPGIPSGSNSNSIEVFVFIASSLKKIEKNTSQIDIFQSCSIKAQNIYLQEGNDLGVRIANAFEKLGSKMMAKEIPILIAATDQPDYDPEMAYAISQKLKEYDAVLGPAQDGGYYVVALRPSVYKNKDLLKRSFSGMEWSHKQVLQQQKERFAQLGIQTWISPKLLRDIDTFDDLCAYQKNFGKSKKEAKQKFKIQKLSFSEFMPDIRVVLPVLNEAHNLALVLERLKSIPYFKEIICADNGSTDASLEVARKMGARVTHCKRRGYGSTCLKALADIRRRGACEAVLFLDADASDDLSELYEILASIVSGRFDLCIGARVPQLAERGALLAHARFGNRLATSLISLFWGFSYRDLGPLRAITWQALEKLKMDDPNFGWTVQMQIRALKKKLRILEIPVAYHKRSSGKSKVSASFVNSMKAGYTILRMIFQELLAKRK